MHASTERSLKLIQQGLCSWCGKLPLMKNNKRFCEIHHQKTTEMRHKLKSNRLHNNLCTQCDNPAESGIKLCKKHRDRANLLTRIITANKISKNICRSCGRSIAPNSKSRCINCMNKNNIFSNKKRLMRLANKICTKCGIKLNTNNTLCGKCLEKMKIVNKIRHDNCMLTGQCTKCKNLALPHITLCESCWFKTKSRRITGSSSNANIIKELLIKQEYKCTYTNKQLIIGINASIDHKIPISLGGSSSIENLHWVDRRINTAKRNLTHDEFKAMIYAIAQSH